MAYSDREMVAFSKIAYMDLESKYNNYCIKHNTDTAPLYELIKDDPGMKHTLECSDVSMRELREWKIAGVDNDSSGMYACIIDTSDGNAAIAYRGSEPAGVLEHLEKDWLNADFRLLNSTATDQQKAVDDFLDTYRDTLSRYDNVSATGHSLGGNLAEYTTIVAEEHNVNNIDYCVSLDGPGHSDEFIEKYRDQIDKNSGKMKHYQWSLVGDLLTRLPGVVFVTVAVSNMANTEDDEEYTSFSKHSLKYLVRNGDDLEEGEQDWLTRVLDTATRGVDHLPKVVGDVMLELVISTITVTMYTKDKMFDQDGHITKEGKELMVRAGIVISVLGKTGLLIPLIKAIAVIVLVVIVIVVVAAVAQLIVDLINKAADHFVKALQSLGSWAAEAVQALREALADMIKQIGSWYNRNFNAGYKFAIANTGIEIDTGVFHDCGCRIEGLYTRIDNIDGLLRMIMLAPDLDMDGFYNMQSASWAFKGSSNLWKFASYLFGTCEDFEKIENSNSQ